MLAISSERIVLLNSPMGKRGFFWREWTDGGESWEQLWGVTRSLMRLVGVLQQNLYLTNVRQWRILCVEVKERRCRAFMDIFETTVFNRKVQKLLTEEEYREFRDELAQRPGMGAVIRGSGGIRKVRWAAKDRGFNKLQKWNASAVPDAG